MDFTVAIEYEPFPDLADALSGFPFEAANIIGERIVDLMHEPKSGRIYKSRKTGKEHQASAPGEAPAIDTENLVNSFEPEQLEDLTAELFSEVFYGAILEDKRDRPFSEPAIERALPDIEEDVLERFENAWDAR